MGIKGFIKIRISELVLERDSLEFSLCDIKRQQEWPVIKKSIKSINIILDGNNKILERLNND